MDKLGLYDKVKEDAPWKPISDGFSRLYVIVRGDLSKSQQAVQAGHAIAQFCLVANRNQSGELQWPNEYLILLKVRDLTDLCVLREKIRASGSSWVEFKEPDIGNQTTAVAAFGEKLEEILRDISLL